MRMRRSPNRNQVERSLKRDSWRRHLTSKMFNPKVQRNKVVQQRGNVSSIEGGIFGHEAPAAPAAPRAPPCIFKAKASADAPRDYAPRVTLETIYPRDDAFADVDPAQEPAAGPMAALSLAEQRSAACGGPPMKVGNGALPAAGGKKFAGAGKKCTGRPVAPTNNIFG